MVLARKIKDGELNLVIQLWNNSFGFFYQSDLKGKFVVKNFRKKTEKIGNKKDFGCGPVAAANMIIYNHIGPVLYSETSDLAHKFFDLISPYAGGTKHEMMLNGLISYFGKDLYTGFVINSNEHKDKSKNRKNNPAEFNKCVNFIKSCIDKNTILCWSNHGNANLPKLWNWHWVNIVGYLENEESFQVLVMDNNKYFVCDFEKWYNTGDGIGRLVGMRGEN